MPTRKELLENLQNEMERLTEAERDSTYALERYGESQERASESMERAAQINSDGFIKASENIKSAAGDIVGGLIGAAFIGLLGFAFSKAIQVLIERTKEFNRKTEMINSIVKLQTIHPYLTYNFIIERSYASDANREDRQTILNGLISDGMITQYKHNTNLNALRIDKDNPELKAHWDRVDEIRNSAQEYLDKKNEGNETNDYEDS